MGAIPLISSDEDLHSRISQIIAADGSIEGDLQQIADPEEAIEYLTVEIPDLVILNFSDPHFDAHILMNAVMSDPWLLHGGIIALCADYDGIKKVEEYRGANIVIALLTDELEKHLRKILTIINSNRRILFQRALGADFLAAISGSFKFANDPVEAACYANLVCNYLFNAGMVDLERKSSLNLALNEMFMNAIEHGNCGVTYEEKTQWMESGRMMYELIELKSLEPAVKSKSVLFEYTIEPGQSIFHVVDEGRGFDWRHLKDASQEENLLALHGRGIFLTRRFTKNLAFNEQGNEVTFEIEHVTDQTVLKPGLFENIEPDLFQPGDLVFNQGEKGDFLYYIVKGSYDVVVNDTVVATLSAEDIFMGEMSFLLNNKRSAAVRARSVGALIRISKKDFVEAIKKKPHYALFLSRLLAQRIQRANAKKSAGDK